MEKAVVNTERKQMSKPFWKAAMPYALGLGALAVAEAAMAASGGPFGAISTFIQTNFMPAVGTIGMAGGVGYGGVHAFKHDYGKAAVGIGTAAAGGFLISQYGWFGQQAGLQAATLGQHAGLVATLANGLARGLGL